MSHPLIIISIPVLWLISIVHATYLPNSCSQVTYASIILNASYSPYSQFVVSKTVIITLLPLHFIDQLYYKEIIISTKETANYS